MGPDIWSFYYTNQLILEHTIPAGTSFSYQLFLFPLLLYTKLIYRTKEGSFPKEREKNVQIFLLIKKVNRIEWTGKTITIVPNSQRRWWRRLFCGSVALTYQRGEKAIFCLHGCKSYAHTVLFLRPIILMVRPCKKVPDIIVKVV